MAISAAAMAVASERPRQHPDDLLPGAIALMARAADRGQEALFSEARILFRSAFAAVDARILVRSAGTWREWDRLDNDDGLDTDIATLAEISIPPERRFALAP